MIFPHGTMVVPFQKTYGDDDLTIEEFIAQNPTDCCVKFLQKYGYLFVKYYLGCYYITCTCGRTWCFRQEDLKLYQEKIKSL